MTAPRPLRIGLPVFNHSDLGRGGGLDIYTRRLVESLAEHDPENEYVLLAASEAQAAAWQYRSWPSNLSWHVLREFEPRQGLATRAARRWRRWRRQPVPAHYGEAYRVRQIDALKLDLLHYPDTLIDPLGLNTPCVLTFFDAQHEYYPAFFTPEHLAWRAARYRASLDQAAHVIAPSHFTAQSLMEKFQVKAEKISIIAVGAPAGFTRAAPDAIARVRDKYRLPACYVYYPANPWPHKNHARLMAALRLLGEQFGNVPDLVLSGRLINEPRDALELAWAAGVEDHVRDLGFVPPEDVPALYSGAGAMVFPSFFEGFGIPLLEAMACECPIAAANATAIPELVGQAALLFDPFDGRSIATALHRLLTEPELARSLAALGVARLTHYQWHDLIPAIVATYHSVANQTRDGRPAAQSRAWDVNG